MPDFENAPHKDVTVAPMGAVHICFVCGPTGLILSANGIDLKLLNIDVNQGKIAKASTSAGSIHVSHLGDDGKHTTLLDVDMDSDEGDELHIRVPIGVSFFEITLAENLPSGYTRAFFFQTEDGYNTIPKFLPLRAANDPKYDPQQLVKEIVLITSHVPPRRGHISDGDLIDIPPISNRTFQVLEHPSEEPVPPPEDK